jgi:hypothetical protein
MLLKKKVERSLYVALIGFCKDDISDLDHEEGVYTVRSIRWIRFGLHIMLLYSKIGRTYTLKVIPSPEREWRREYSLPCCTGEYSLKLRD